MLAVMMWFSKSQSQKEQDGKEREEQMDLGREMLKSPMKVNHAQTMEFLATPDWMIPRLYVEKWWTTLATTTLKL